MDIDCSQTTHERTRSQITAMSNAHSDDKKLTLRIDEILLWEGLVTHEQIATALKEQKEHGGKIGSHLMRLGFVDEAALVKGLAKQYGIDGVVISRLTIDSSLLRFIPAHIAHSMKVIPYDFIPEDNLLKVACEDPLHSELERELSFVSGGRKIKLAVAAELAIMSALLRYYPQKSASTRVSVAKSGPVATVGLPSNAPLPAGDQPAAILVVSDEMELDRHLRRALNQQRYEVVMAESADAAVDLIKGRSFHTVFIRDTVSGDYIDLIDRARKRSPRTKVRFYSSVGSLILDDFGTEQAELMSRNLDLLTSLLASKDNRPANHSGTVGKYAERLAKRLGIPARDRSSIVTAAYLHDLAKTYYGTSESDDSGRESISLTIKLLDSLNYPPLVTGILQAMYINLRDKYQRRLPIEALGGNIVTICDIFCAHVPLGEKLPLEKFETLKTKFEDLIGKLFLEEVVRAFLTMVEEELLVILPRGRYNQVLAYCQDSSFTKVLSDRLRKEGYRVVIQSSLESTRELFDRGKPDLMLIVQHGEPEAVRATITALVEQGIDLATTPTLLVVDHWATSHLTSIFDLGIEDLLPLDSNLDMLLAKVKKIQSRLETKSSIREDAQENTGAGGRLEDLNLIDLLQAMGPGRKTAKITISGETEEVIIYMSAGELIYAEGAGRIGPEAVYEALSWRHGHWHSIPMAQEQLPEANIFSSYEAILMEGCRLLDERLRTGQV
jgi:DNA-binding response OmpR family regulator